MTALTDTGAPARLAEWLRAFSPVVVLSGAGCSTASGIGDYRDATGQWKRTAPVQHDDFVRYEHVRKRYWARSMFGWRDFAAARPNAAHLALAALQRAQWVSGVITQNVDGLHQTAGMHTVVDLHGRLDQVRCLDCQRTLPRSAVQLWLERENVHLTAAGYAPAPDGDADVEFPAAWLEAVAVPECECGGLLKPDVVFYGGSVPRERVQAGFQMVEDARGLLVVGSSLMVYSGLRFCRRARESGKSLAAINLGVTRADAWLQLKCVADCSEVLPALASQLGP